MRLFIHRSFLLFLASWLLLSSIGVSWTQSTCIFTGIQKEAWSVTKPINLPKKAEIKCSTCFHFKHFQIKHHSVFTTKKQTISAGLHPYENRSFTEPIEFINYDSECIANSSEIPIDQRLRRAYLQSYQI
jgi:hypothetical protein